MKIYRGDRTIDGLQVTVDEQPLNPRFDIKKVCQSGFEWGFEGAASAQLALALLADHYDSADQALAHYKPFMREIVANFANEWEMTSQDIDTALANIGVVT